MQFPKNSAIESEIDYQATTSLLAEAERQGRYILYEHETYSLLQNLGAESAPKARLLQKGKMLAEEDLIEIPGQQIVLKIVSPAIIDKSEVGGVRIVEKTIEKVRSTWRRMMMEIPEGIVTLIEKNPEHAPVSYRGLEGNALWQAVVDDIQGVLLVQYMPPDSEAFGNELIVGIRNTREFGMIISVGLGGTDTELYAERFRKGQAVVAASTLMTDSETLFGLFKKTISYQKLAGLTRGQKRIVTDEQILECFASFIDLGNYYSPANSEAPYVIEELEINPFAFTDYMMIPLDGMCRFSKPISLPVPRPFCKIDKLLHPESIGIVGVSTTRENYGRVILQNILENGFDPENVRMIKPGLSTFKGIKCASDLASLDIRLDLFIVAIGSEQVPDLVDEIIRLRAAETVILLPSGLGETNESRERTRQIEKKISTAHEVADGGPVFLGGNCLGVISHPGKYDTLITPDVKLPKQRGDRKRKTAFVSQSGAFMISRLSKRPELDPAYMISVGNQNDLTLGDMLNYLSSLTDIEVIAIYAEDFKEMDGLNFIQAVQKAVMAGKDVVFYKAGRNPEWKSATSGHTASLVDAYKVCESCVGQAGGIVAQTLTQFEDLLLLSQRLYGKEINGNRLAAVSGARFEAVSMADSIQSDDYRLKLASISSKSHQQLLTLLESKKLEQLVEVKNPLNINPAADDDAHVSIVRLLVEDSNVDAVVVGLDPLSPAMRTLSEAETTRYSIADQKSIALLMPQLAKAMKKPIVGVVDGGRLYDPLVDELMDNDMAVFRSSDNAVRALALYIKGRLHAERLRLSSPARDSAFGA